MRATAQAPLAAHDEPGARKHVNMANLKCLPWSENEDNTLLRRCSETPGNWQVITRGMGRSVNACKARFSVLRRRERAGSGSRRPRGRKVARRRKHTDNDEEAEGREDEEVEEEEEEEVDDDEDEAEQEENDAAPASAPMALAQHAIKRAKVDLDSNPCSAARRPAPSFPMVGFPPPAAVGPFAPAPYWAWATQFAAVPPGPFAVPLLTATRERARPPRRW